MAASVARSERVPVVLTLAGSPSEPARLLAFVPATGGALAIETPALSLTEGWKEPFSELAGQATESASIDAGEGWRLLGTGRLRRGVR